ncbi:MAG: hypothetical protein HOV94_39140 [Saccharothrix sp.]|nr:hypothetical protein [Saccharothrix sp.]
MTDAIPGLVDRPVEEILAIRVRAAELRVLDRNIALVKLQDDIRMSVVPGEHDAEQAKLVEARRIALDALDLARREVAVQAGTSQEHIRYESASGGPTLHRYAAVLMFDDPTLSLEQAVKQALRDESARFDAYMARHHPDVDPDDEDDEFADDV